MVYTPVVQVSNAMITPQSQSLQELEKMLLEEKLPMDMYYDGDAEDLMEFQARIIKEQEKRDRERSSSKGERSKSKRGTDSEEEIDLKMDEVKIKTEHLSSWPSVHMTKEEPSPSSGGSSSSSTSSSEEEVKKERSKDGHRKRKTKSRRQRSSSSEDEWEGNLLDMTLKALPKKEQEKPEPKKESFTDKRSPEELEARNRMVNKQLDSLIEDVKANSKEKI